MNTASWVHTEDTLRRQLARSVAPIDDAWSLPPAMYTDPQVYELEKQTLFSHQWLLVGRCEQIPRVGDYFTVDLFDHRLVVVRSTEQTIQAFSRVCLHRSALLAEGSGHCKTFICPYHSWSFDLHGRLRSARDIANSAFTATEAQLPTIRTEVWQGCIFLNFDRDAKPLGAQLGGLAQFIAPYALADMVLQSEYVEFDTKVNWKVLCENFMEAYHHPGPHDDLLQKPFPYAASYVLDNGGEPWSVLAMPNPSQDALTWFPSIPSLDDWRRTGLVASIIYPNTLLTFNGDSAWWYQIIPHAFDHFTLRIRTLVPKATLETDHFETLFKRLREEFQRPVHLQDEAINASVWEGLKSAQAQQGRLHPEYELALWQMNRWWYQQVGTRLG